MVYATGAGQNFAERLLKQFNPTMTISETKSKAAKMFSSTKGRRVYVLKKKYMEGLIDEDLEGKVFYCFLNINGLLNVIIVQKEKKIKK